MENIAIFPGSFDPFTIGHESVLRRGLPLFDKVIVAIGYHLEKKSLFPLEKRKEWIEKIFKDEPKVTVSYYKGLTVNYCKSVGAKYILRGLRTSSDFEYERAIAQNNKTLYPELDTIFILTTPGFSHINSTIVRDIILNDGPIDKFVPKEMVEEINKFKF